METKERLIFIAKIFRLITKFSHKEPYITNVLERVGIEIDKYRELKEDAGTGPNNQ